MNKMTISIVKMMTGLVIIFCFIGFSGTKASAQIYEPEGLNMPGAWNSWTNPPTNNLALASSTQVTGGKIVKITDGTMRWQTVLKVKESGGDLTPGTYTWLFTSGPATSAFQNKWAAVTVIMDSLQLYTKEGAADNSITLENNHYYIMNWQDGGYSDTHAIFMKTSAEPGEIDSVSVPVNVQANTAVPVTIFLQQPPSPEEKFYIRYSADGWNTSTAIQSPGVTGSTAVVTLPGFASGTVVSYYAFSSTIGNIISNYDMLTIDYDNKEGDNYTFTVGGGAPTIAFANLQWPGSAMIGPGMALDVFGQVNIPGVTGQTTPAPGLSAWVGYHTENTDPATWTNWAVATYNGPAGNNDEFKKDLGSLLTTAGVYYYVMRYQYNGGAYLYGGYSETGGGFWDGTTNISGRVDVEVGIEEPNNSDFRVWPNPFTDEVRIELTEPSVIRINDLQGRSLMTEKFNTGIQTIETNPLEPGIYLLTMTSNHHSSTRKVFKQ
jgi:hypothetical protein